MATAEHVIDLTGDDDHEVSHRFNVPPTSSRTPVPLPPSASLRAAALRANLANAPAPAPHGHNGPPPPKRQRVAAPPLPSTSQQPRRPPYDKQEYKNKLLLCLSRQVIPDLHAVIKPLKGNVNKHLLGKDIIRIVTDGEFERSFKASFKAGGGEVPASLQAHVAARIRALVAEKASLPRYQKYPGSSAEPASVLPSIEDATAAALSPTFSSHSPVPLRGQAPPEPQPARRFTNYQEVAQACAEANRYYERLNQEVPVIPQRSINPPENPEPARRFMNPREVEQACLEAQRHHGVQQEVPAIPQRHVESPENSEPARRFMNKYQEVAQRCLEANGYHKRLNQEMSAIPQRHVDPHENLGHPEGQMSSSQNVAEPELMDVDETDGWAEEDQENEQMQNATPSPPRKRKASPATPQRLHTRRKAGNWQSGKTYEAKRPNITSTSNSWFGLAARPYLNANARQQIQTGIKNSQLVRLEHGNLKDPVVIHVDFREDEIRYLRYVARSLYGRDPTRSRDVCRDLRHMLKKDKDKKIRDGIRNLAASSFRGYSQPPSSLLTRSGDDVTNFLNDLLQRQNNQKPQLLKLERDDDDVRNDLSRKDRLPSLLFSREIAGNRAVGSTRSMVDFSTSFKIAREDLLEPKLEWTNAAGDIMTITWASNTHFICGTTTHSDSHNQQYNKPGNLLFGSVAAKSLRSYPHHRIDRPLVTQGENSSESMRQSQDPWLYTSVVSSDYQPIHDLSFTSSFDNTVKVWRTTSGSLDHVATWDHSGRVNFVVSSQDADGKVATAADVPTEAVRVYHLDPVVEVPETPFDTFSCTRTHDSDQMPSTKWAYFPSAIRWGLAPEVRHLLLVGYSPRSTEGDDYEIPEDKQRTGELCLWDTRVRQSVKINNAAMSNVFEVAWHPFRKSFAAATSASGLELDPRVKTQIRLFQEQTEEGKVSYTAFKTLDCFAMDINELVLKPNSAVHSYVAVGCTDGRVYVWDSATGDFPVCILQHGDPVETLIDPERREQEDIGVKFLAWATTSDRLYTGSSDGMIKVWNIKHSDKAQVKYWLEKEARTKGKRDKNLRKAVSLSRDLLVKDLLEARGPVTAASFSPDFKKLAVGDGAGRVSLLDMEDEIEAANDPASSSGAVSGERLRTSNFLRVQLLGGVNRTLRCPVPIIPHPEPEPAIGVGQQDPSKEYLERSELIIHPDPTIGAVQGPQYDNTGLFRAELHLNGELSGPLLAGTEADQQRHVKVYKPLNRQQKQTEGTLSVEATHRLRHQHNQASDFDLDQLDYDTLMELKAERVEWPGSSRLDFDLSYEEEGDGAVYEEEDDDDDGTIDLDNE